MRRRSFFGFLGGVVAFSLAAGAEQPGGARRVAVLMGYSESDPYGQARFKSFVQSLQELGWPRVATLTLKFAGLAPISSAYKKLPRSWLRGSPT
jgi:hypothetical protein